MSAAAFPAVARIPVFVLAEVVSKGNVKKTAQNYKAGYN
jgi:hypothetical protein